MGRLFGTDGIRGIFGETLTLDLAYKTGVAAGKFFAGKDGIVIIGRDTRKSGETLEMAVAKGLADAGVKSISCGIIPTPAVAYLTKKHAAAGGIVISASHNPPNYNGIKLFGPNGYKLSDETEAEIENNILTLETSTNDYSFDLSPLSGAVKDYIDMCVSTTETRLDGLKIALDCGHGASYTTSKSALEALGAEVIAINTSFNGDDINVDSGSTNLEAVKAAVKSNNADLGISHDGDADRVLAIDNAGNEIDGDYIMAICALRLKNQGKLIGNRVISTVMCNLGFVKAMEREGIKLTQTQVGDRYVLEQMIETGSNFGGEQSGHIIFSDYNTTGDGLVTAIQLASALKESDKKLSELKDVMEKFPQVLINVPVVDRNAFYTNQNLVEVIRDKEKLLGDAGRVLVRPSGTESLVRVMVEAKTKETAKTIANELVDFINSELG